MSVLSQVFFEKYPCQLMHAHFRLSSHKNYEIVSLLFGDFTWITELLPRLQRPHTWHGYPIGFFHILKS